VEIWNQKAGLRSLTANNGMYYLFLLLSSIEVLGTEVLGTTSSSLIVQEGKVVRA
jgi:hypothetical protein